MRFFVDSREAYESCIYDRKKGYAKQLMNALLEDAKGNGICVIELKATEAGYHLYKSVGFEDVVSKYHNMGKHFT